MPNSRIDSESSKILVTGCAGFIGSHLTETLLAAGHTVIGIDCFRDYYEPVIKKQNISNFVNHPNFGLINEDICSMKSFPGVDYVFHQAAQAGVRTSWGNQFEQYLHDNIAATQRLLEWYKGEKSLKKFIYASSSSVYGNAQIIPVRENTILQPVSPYGVSKLAAEHLCNLYFVNYGLPAISLRYFTVFGPRQRPDMAIHKFFKGILSGSSIDLYGDGTQTRDFTYIQDIIKANIVAALAGSPGEIYNIGGGNRIMIKDLIEKIEDITGRNANITFDIFQKGDVQDTWADINKAKQDLNWSPIVGIDEGLKYMYDWLSGTWEK